MAQKLLQRFCAAVLCLSLAACLTLPVGAACDMPITLSAEGESVYLYNIDTRNVILDENSTQPRYIASTTKMMTALLLLESGADLNSTITIPDTLKQEFEDIAQYNGSTMNLKIGEQVRLIDLLYGILLPSANDAASAIANYVSEGDTGAFVQQMNSRAAELGCTNTTFTCPHGLYDAGNVSTAQDLGKIAEACFANETFMKVANSTEYTVPADNMNPNEQLLENTNPIINPNSPYYRDSVGGMKTGFTTLAGKCFVTTAQYGPHRYMLVILGAKKEDKGQASYIYTETDQLLDWLFSRYSDRKLLSRADAVATVPLNGGSDAQEVTLYADQDVIQNAYDDAEVAVQVDAPDKLVAPVKEGEVVGTATVTLDGETVATVNLLADRAYPSALLEGGRNVLLLTPVLLLLLAALAMLTIKWSHTRVPLRAPAKVKGPYGRRHHH